MEDDVAIFLGELDLLVRAAWPRLGKERQFERLVDMLGDGLARRYAALLECRPDPALRSDPSRVALERDVRFQSVERQEPETLCDRAALRLAGHQLDALAVADGVDRDPMAEIFAHLQLSFRKFFDTSVRKLRPKFAERSCAMAKSVIARLASAIDGRHDSFAPVPFTCDRVAPLVDSPLQRADQLSNPPAKPRIVQAELAMLGVHRLDEPLREGGGSAIAFRRAWVGFESNDDQGTGRRQHRESPVDRVRDLSLREPVRTARLGDRALEQRLPALRAVC